MKTFILGGTGFLGRNIIEVLRKQNHQIFALVRNIKTAQLPSEVTIFEGDARIKGKWQQQVAESDCVINLSGCNIAQTWTKEIKDEIYESRVHVTRNVVASFPPSSNKKHILINASAVGYYGFCGDNWCDEKTPVGGDFLAKVCADWEEAALLAEKKGIQVIIPRIGVVLGHGGALEKMAKMFRRFLGSQLGTGTQWFSWIHIQDILQFIELGIHGKLQGIYNLCAPNPVQNKVLTQTLADILGVSVLLRTPTFAIRLALGEFASVVLEGQRVCPKKLLDAKFPFRFEHLETALRDLNQ